MDLPRPTKIEHTFFEGFIAIATHPTLVNPSSPTSPISPRKQRRGKGGRAGDGKVGGGNEGGREGGRKSTIRDVFGFKFGSAFSKAFFDRKHDGDAGEAQPNGNGDIQRDSQIIFTKSPSPLPSHPSNQHPTSLPSFPAHSLPAHLSNRNPTSNSNSTLPSWPSYTFSFPPPSLTLSQQWWEVENEDATLLLDLSNGGSEWNKGTCLC